MISRRIRFKAIFRLCERFVLLLWVAGPLKQLKPLTELYFLPYIYTALTILWLKARVLYTVYIFDMLYSVCYLTNENFFAGAPAQGSHTTIF